MPGRSPTPAAVLLALIATLALAAGATGAQAAGQQLPPTSCNLYFGDLHSHTGYSDGWEGTPATAFASATEAAPTSWPRPTAATH